jgi:regulator of RNase E activity RraA
LEPFEELGTATISSALREVCGILKSIMVGPVAFTPGLKAVGTATTVSFLPRREDMVTTRQEEEQESQSALWAGVIGVQDGDVLVVDAQANMESGNLSLQSAYQRQTVLSAERLDMFCIRHIQSLKLRNASCNLEHTDT